MQIGTGGFTITIQAPAGPAPAVLVLVNHCFSL